MFIHAKNACLEGIIKGHSCHSCTVKSAHIGVGADNVFVFPDYFAHHTGSFRSEH